MTIINQLVHRLSHLTPVSDLIAPKQCVGCKKVGNYLCKLCWQQVEFNPLPVRARIDQPAFDQVWAVCFYQPPISQLISQMKYSSIKDICDFVAEILFYCGKWTRPNLITWVPSAKKRIRQRGFNQAKLIAQKFSELGSLPLAPLLTKAKHTQRQAGIANRKQRALSQANSFCLNRSLDLNLKLGLKSIKNKQKRVLLIDDVITTGATTNECAKILKKAGFARVNILTLAHET